MQIEDLLRKTKDAVDIHQVFGEPYDRDGVTIIPVARITGGGGGGAGPRATEHSGSGMGYGFRAEPAGVYVIRGEDVKWLPAVNANAAIAGALFIGAVAVLRTPRIIKQARKLLR